jgi:multidrug efflux pump subunit AcrB
MDRREFLATMAAVPALATLQPRPIPDYQIVTNHKPAPGGLPGRYPGRVVTVHSPRCIDEETEKVALRVLDVIKQEAGPNNVDSTLGYVGAQSADHPINAIYLWTSGPNEGVLQVQLRHGSGIRIEEFKEKLRKSFAAHLPGVGFSFEPSDIVSRVLSFGASTPVEVSVNGPNLAKNREMAEKIMAELGKIPSLRDLQIGQTLDYPTVKVTVDREKSGLVGLSMQEIADSFVPATSSSR